KKEVGMPNTRFRWFGICLPLILVNWGQAGNPPDVEALVDRSIAASGGAANLSKFQTGTVRGKGKHYGTGKTVENTGDRYVKQPQRMSIVIDTVFRGTKEKLIWVLNGDKGWHKLNDDNAQAMDKEVLTEEQEQFHAGRVATLLPLKSPDYELTFLGESTVAGRPAAGIKVSHKARREVNLYFDRESALLVKSETRIKEAGKEIKQEVLYADYREMEGTRRPTRITVKRDNKLLVEEEVLEYRPLERPDGSLFAKP